MRRYIVADTYGGGAPPQSQSVSLLFLSLFGFLSRSPTRNISRRELSVRPDGWARPRSRLPAGNQWIGVERDCCVASARPRYDGACSSTLHTGRPDGATAYAISRGEDGRRARRTRGSRGVHVTMHCLSTGQSSAQLIPTTPSKEPGPSADLGWQVPLHQKRPALAVTVPLWEARADRLLPDPAILCRTRTDDETEGFWLGGRD